MPKQVLPNLKAAVFGSFTMAAVAASMPSVAGPGCLSGYSPMGGGYPHYGAMGGPAGYPQMPPYPMIGTPPSYGMMPAPYGRSAPSPRGSSAPEKAAPSPQPAASASAAGDSVTVRISGMRFEPATVSVKPGTTVTWVQQSPMPHTVSGASGDLKSSTLRSGQQYSYTFDAAGSFDYACDFHPGMKGRVIVEDGAEKS